MHLSRVQLNPARRGGRKLLGSPQAMHAAVLASFPQSEQDRGRVLWRVDHNTHQCFLYVLSRPEPDFAHIIEQAGWQTTQDGWAVRPYGPLLERLEAGQTWAFRLTANPSRAGAPDARHVRRRETANKKARSQRFGHVTAEQQREWLVARVERWGFEIPMRENGSGAAVPDVVVHDRRVERFRRQEHQVTVTKVTYDGVLIIRDVEALREAMVTGMGRAKAYGCGLLTLAPAEPR